MEHAVFLYLIQLEETVTTGGKPEQKRAMVFFLKKAPTLAPNKRVFANVQLVHFFTATFTVVASKNGPVFVY